MMKIILLIMLGLGLSVFFGYFTQIDQGVVILSWDDNTLAITGWVALSILILAYVALQLLIMLIRGLTSGVKATSPWSTNRKRNKARRLTTKGLLDLAEGKWERARRRLTTVADDAETPLINYLAAARATHELGKDDDTLDLLGRAQKSTEGAELAVGLTQAQLQLGQKQHEQCLATLMRLRAKYPKHKFVLKLLMKTYAELKDWQKLKDLLPEIRKSNILDNKQELALMHQVYLEMLNACSSGNTDEAKLQKLKEAWNEVPAQGKKLSPKLVLAYAKPMNNLGEGLAAEEAVRNILKNHWDNELVELYSVIKGADIGSQILFLEQQLKARPNDAGVQLALARLSLQAENWDKAEQYLLATIGLEKNTQAFAELCRFYQAKGDMEKAIEYFQQGAQSVLPELPMPA